MSGQIICPHWRQTPAKAANGRTNPINNVCFLTQGVVIFSSAKVRGIGRN